MWATQRKVKKQTDFLLGRQKDRKAEGKKDKDKKRHKIQKNTKIQKDEKKEKFETLNCISAVP